VAQIFTHAGGAAQPPPGQATGAPGVASYWRRRVWWLREYDPYEGGPCEAVVTASIEAGRPSRIYPEDAG
jgi:hypothetical protein